MAKQDLFPHTPSGRSEFYWGHYSPEQVVGGTALTGRNVQVVDPLQRFHVPSGSGVRTIVPDIRIR